MSSLAVLVAAVAFGQATQPQVPEDVKKQLQYFVGEWTYEATEEDKVLITGKWSVRRAGDHCVVTHFAATGPDGGVEGTGVLGWNSETNEIVHMMFASDGGHETHRSKVKSSVIWEGELTGSTGDGKHNSSRVRLEKKANEFKWSEIDRKEGDTAQPDRNYLFRRT